MSSPSHRDRNHASAGEPSDSRRLSHKASKRFVLAAMLFVTILSLSSAYFIVFGLQDSEMQERIEAARKGVQEPVNATPADTSVLRDSIPAP